jgi:hypothetical protein
VKEEAKDVVVGKRWKRTMNIVAEDQRSGILIN